jgi:hypothetical protein
VFKSFTKLIEDINSKFQKAQLTTCRWKKNKKERFITLATIQTPDNQSQHEQFNLGMGGSCL